MSDTTKKTIVARHKKLAFFGVIGSDGTEKFLRMPKFTQLSQNKNPSEYSRQYVDESFQETDITGYLINARPSTVCDWCNNNIESVKLKLLDDICKALGCEISDILTII